mmetsp:Transcript_13883/g.35682  ORF Transcript_13883/g.35682 Transcript_13883/m.35682 type:complete len:297 (+) Transcript_13883:150-1040(+)
MHAARTTHSTALGPGSAGPHLALAPSAPGPGAPTGCYGNGTAPCVFGNAQQPCGGAPACVVDPSALASGNRQHTQYPIVTGTSVLATTYKDGVLIACDTLASYGSTKRYKSMERMHTVNDSVVIAASGEMSDFSHITKLVDELSTEDYCHDDGIRITPKETHAYLSRVMYNRRNKFDPLWNSLIVGGFYDDKPFLGTIGMIGTNYTDTHVATGFGNHLARPIFRERFTPDMDEATATQMLHDALKVCYYRDKQSINKFQVAKVTKEGTTISEPFSLEMKWDYKHFENPALNAVGTW